jgi:radical SAM protein with 4Fe4S-binding SPASM domain
MDNKNFYSAQTFYEKNVNYSFKSFENKNLLPHRYVFILTNLCNLACTFCFQERKKRADRMSTEDWLKLVKQIPSQSRITLTGGEPLIYKDFEKIFVEANKNSQTNMITNGLLINDKVIDLLISQKNFINLGISIDNIGNTNRDFKTGKWEELVSNIAKFRAKRDKIKSKTVINIKSVVLDETIPNLFNIHKYCVEVLGSDTHDLQLLKGAEIQYADYMFDYNDIHKEYKAHKYENFEEFISQLNLIREYNIKNNSKCFLHPNIIDLNSKNEILESDFDYLNNEKHDSKHFAKCLSPWTSVHINVDGNLFPCMAVSMGNVKNTPLKDIIFSDKFEDFKKTIDKNNTINGCNRCGWLKSKKI